MVLLEVVRAVIVDLSQWVERIAVFLESDKDTSLTLHEGRMTLRLERLRAQAQRTLAL